MMEWIRFGIVALLFALGIAALYLSIFGTYRLRFALNRIHSAAITDTLVLILFTLAFIVAAGPSFTALKFAMVLGLQWCTSPLASHMMAKFEYLTDDRLYQNCAFIDRTKDTSADSGDTTTASGGDANVSEKQSAISDEKEEKHP